jgi:hypothetical protein
LRSRFQNLRLITVLGGVYFVSGFTALLYQVVWQRMLGLFSGSDVRSGGTPYATGANHQTKHIDAAETIGSKQTRTRHEIHRRRAWTRTSTRICSPGMSVI